MRLGTATYLVAIVSFCGSVAAFSQIATTARSRSIAVRPLALIQVPSENVSKRPTRFRLSATAINGDANTDKKPPTMMKSMLSASLLIALDVGFRKLFQALAISFPSSLGGCCILFFSMLLLPMGSRLFHLFSPGAALLAKWLPVFFVPSLITLPLARSVGPPIEVRTWGGLVRAFSNVIFCPMQKF